MGDTIVVPYNDKAALEQALEQHKGQVGALILEGLMGAARYGAGARTATCSSPARSAPSMTVILYWMRSFHYGWTTVAYSASRTQAGSDHVGKNHKRGLGHGRLRRARRLNAQYSPQHQVLHHAARSTPTRSRPLPAVAMLRR
jgi:hypothetical protein